MSHILAGDDHPVQVLCQQGVVGREADRTKLLSHLLPMDRIGIGNANESCVGMDSQLLCIGSRMHVGEGEDADSPRHDNIDLSGYRKLSDDQLATL